MNNEREHKLVLVNQTDKFAEWECPVCMRMVRVGSSIGIKILNPGDQLINHGAVSTTPLLKLGDTSVSKTTIH